MKFPSASRMALALTLATPPEAIADELGQCAHQRDPEKKIASCLEALKLSPYPRVHQWIYREIARAHRERGDIESAITSYTLSLAAEEGAQVRREMEELTRSHSDVANAPIAPRSMDFMWQFLPW